MTGEPKNAHVFDLTPLWNQPEKIPRPLLAAPENARPTQFSIEKSHSAALRVLYWGPALTRGGVLGPKTQIEGSRKQPLVRDAVGSLKGTRVSSSFGSTQKLSWNFYRTGQKSRRFAAVSL